MNYVQSLKELSKFINYEKRFTHKSDYDIKDFKTFLATVNSPENYSTNITVAGTKGKGSTVRYISNALINLGYNVGSFYSPHIRDVRERITFNNNWIDEDNFSAMFTYIHNHLYNREQTYKTYFEILTSMALLYFVKKGTNFNILEVGLGGRLDSTNVAPNKYAIITHIGLDHTDVLGNTVKKIAFEKAGIIKPGGTVITGFNTDSVTDIILQRGMVLRAKTIIAEKFVSNIDNDIHKGIISWTYKGVNYKFLTEMKGIHQIHNMILAFLTLKELENDNLIQSCYTTNLFSGSPLSGRFEIREKSGHKFILDGGHNSDAIEMLTQNFNKYFGNKTVDLIFTCMQNKDFGGIIEKLKKLNVNRVFLDRLNNPREADIHKIKEKFDVNGFKNIFTENAEKFIDNSKSDYIIITGSFYLVGKWELILDKTL